MRHHHRLIAEGPQPLTATLYELHICRRRRRHNSPRDFPSAASASRSRSKLCLAGADNLSRPGKSHLFLIRRPHHTLRTTLRNSLQFPRSIAQCHRGGRGSTRSRPARGRWPTASFEDAKLDLPRPSTRTNSTFVPNRNSGSTLIFSPSTCQLRPWLPKSSRSVKIT